MPNRRIVLQSLAAGAAAVAAPVLRAEEDKSPITVLVGAASSMDATARLVAQQLGAALGRPVIVVSRLGAGGRVALGELKRAAPDGRTLMFSTSSPFAIYPHVYQRLDYDPVGDFTPIAGVSWFDVGVATAPGNGITDLKQWLAWAKQQGHPVSYGEAPGAGSSSHFVGISLGLDAGLPLTPVHYKDSGVGIIDLASGRIPLMITGTSPLAAMHKAGKIRLLAVSGARRSALAPDVPTLVEAGLDITIQNSAGLYGPAKLPPGMAERLRAAVMPMFKQPDVLQKMKAQGMTPQPLDGKQLAASLAADSGHFAGLVKASGYVPKVL
jgi:tripartite-type tricarboxylate transporter receptor subunit TctC